MDSERLALAALILLSAAVYASVGHGGASAYLAILSLFGIPREEMATSALLLNILVASIGMGSYARAGRLSWALTWPFLVLSVPAAYLGGTWEVSPRAYALLLALALLAAAGRLWWPAREQPQRAVPLVGALAAGTAIGTLSGILGIGGGIFLSPLMILAGWAGAKQTAATSAVFILVNSLAGLAGRATRHAVVIGNLAPLVAVAFIGGLAGAQLGVNRLLPLQLRRILAVLLLFVAIKLFANWLHGR